MATPVVVFTYGKLDESNKASLYADDDEIEKAKMEQARLRRYYESLNIWFVETAKRDCPNIYLETVDIENIGASIKFSPLEYAHSMGTTIDDVQSFLDFIHEQMNIIDATVSCRQSFIELVEAQDNLRYIELPGWAGIGAIQYIPTEWLKELDDLTNPARNEINKINMELVHQLKTNDSAFSLGRAGDGLACARFGLITQDTDMEELLGLVYATGKEIEESSRFVEQMAEMVKKGIEQANQDLEKENESRLVQEGILRQVPLVASFVNWFSPPPKEATNVKGRTFNLASGTIKSTEETYRNRMQILESPPETPKRQQPLKSVLKRVSLLHQDSSLDKSTASTNSTEHSSSTDQTSSSNNISTSETSSGSTGSSNTSSTQASTSLPESEPPSTVEVTNEQSNDTDVSNQDMDLK